MNATVRTFRAPDPRTALDAVKAAFGDQAVILHTREVGGGLWGKPEIEVTAAASGESARERPGRGAPAELEGEIAALRRLVEGMRSELRAVADNGRPATNDDVPPQALRVLRRLHERGIEPAIADELVRIALRSTANGREADMLEAVATEIRRRLPAARAPWQRGDQRVLALIGPTGVGKTTTIAKIAARALLEERLKLALITIDTYRIGASEHLGRYGEIMGIETHIARDAANLAAIVERCADRDLILVDTAGRSDAAAAAAQADLLRIVPDIELHLVLSAASGGREIAAQARRYQRCAPQRVIFSKLDEADGPGSVLSAAAVLARPISCITDGQRVPDDLHSATSPRFNELVLGR